MFNSIRLIFVIAPLLVVAVTLALLQPAWAPRNLGRDKRLDAIDRRIEKKTRIITKLIDGHITLFETAALFRRWNKEYPQLPADSSTPGDSEDERSCYQVITWARSYLSQWDPDKVGNIAQRLKDELRRHKEQHGKVVLPAGDSVDDDTNDPHHPVWRGGHDQ
jgi:hypothetical protein